MLALDPSGAELRLGRPETCSRSELAQLVPYGHEGYAIVRPYGANDDSGLHRLQAWQLAILALCPCREPEGQVSF